MKNSPNNNIQNQLQSKAFDVEQQLASMLGVRLYKQSDGFTQDQIYTYGGREDYVFVLTLKQDSESFQEYGEEITVCFFYTLNERKSLEDNVTSLNDKPYAKAELLVPIDNEELADKLINKGIRTRDIVQLFILPSTEKNNTFPSKEKRTPKTIEIPFETKGGGRDISWIYESLKRLKEKGVGLMPEDKALYLAYKLILEREELTEEEKSKIFNSNGKVSNEDVLYYFFIWKKEAGIITEREIVLLNQIEQNKLFKRMNLLDKVLDEMGMNVDKLCKKNPTLSGMLLKKMITFRDKSFNTNGEFPLYMDFMSLLHIYFRHVEEFSVSSQFADRDKFQLEEKDILTVMDIVMRELNDEYQIYKQTHPTNQFNRCGVMAYYYNGDYYNVVVDSDGRVSTFYRGLGKKEK